MELLIGRNVYASQLQSGINDETALTSSVVWQFADQYDYGEIDETLKELFPKERLDFKEILIGVLSGDITFSAQLLKQLVKEQFSSTIVASVFDSPVIPASDAKTLPQLRANTKAPVKIIVFHLDDFFI